MIDNAVDSSFKYYATIWVRIRKRNGGKTFFHKMFELGII